MPLSVFLFIIYVLALVVVSLRQSGGRYSFIFIGYAIIELVQLTEHFLFRPYDYLVTGALGFGIIYALITTGNRQLRNSAIALLFTSLIALLFLPDFRSGFSLIIFQHAVIFIILLRDAYTDMKYTMEINLFYVFMLLNEINAIFMYLSLWFSSGVLSDVSQLQIMMGTGIAVWFTVFRYDRPKVGIKI